MIGIMVIPNAFAENLYYYVDPIPTWVSPNYVAANMGMYETTIELAFLGWSTANPNLIFIETTSPSNAHIQVAWVKEFGTGIGGHATWMCAFDGDVVSIKIRLGFAVDQPKNANSIVVSYIPILAAT
jgi:hypothetical protein